MHGTSIKIIHQLCLAIIRSFAIAINKQDDKQNRGYKAVIWWMRRRLEAEATRRKSWVQPYLFKTVLLQPGS
jgi:hypothetical protein